VLSFAEKTLKLTSSTNNYFETYPLNIILTISTYDY